MKKRTMFTVFSFCLIVTGGCAQSPPPASVATIEASAAEAGASETEALDQPNLNGDLLKAVANKDAVAAEQALEAGADPDVTSSNGDPALKRAIFAARFGRSPEFVELLVAHGADVNALDARGSSLLAVAADEKQLDVVQILLEAGADVNGTLAESGLRTDGAETLYESALSLAAGRNQIEIVELLIAHGADVNQAERLHKRTPLHAAAWYNNADIVTLLIDAGADPNFHSDRAYGETPLHFAARKGATDALQALLDGGADVDAQTRIGLTPLMSTMIKGRTVTRSRVTSILLDAGAKLNIQDTTIGNTALHYAAQHGWVNEIPMLIDHGAPIDQQNNVGNTSLHAAAVWGHPEAVSILIEHGARLDIENDRGETALDLAKTDEIVEMLQAAGAGQ